MVQRRGKVPAKVADCGRGRAEGLAQAEVEFELKEMEGHATNVHYFGGVQFQQFGLHHVEIYLATNCGCAFRSR